MKEVTFSYPLAFSADTSLKIDFVEKNKHTILDHCNLTIEKGEIVGISGVSGSGKTTLLTLLSGCERRFDGEIRIQNVLLPDIPRKEVVTAIAMVSQNPFLFTTTIRENLCLGETYDEDDISYLLELVDLKDDIDAMPQELDTKLGEVGITLSGGQRQRLTIVRALLRKPRILLLDDCLSAVDPITEARFLSKLPEFIKGVTVIFATHRTSAFALCSHVYSIENKTVRIVR